ncbi:MAG TPA: hypothetical protein VFR35_16480 [Actinoplanes sp.]|nr:hypothetical protein [Actinoplanes sp.]
MSSRTRIWSERRAPRTAAALLVVLLAALGYGPAPAAAAVPLPVAAVLTAGGQTSLVVDLSASTRPGGQSVSVTLDGVPQPADLVPVVSGDLRVALVVDTSAAGAAALPAWLSAGARFILEAPAETQAVVIADTAPASAITTPQRGPVEIVRALNTVRAGGERDTAAALALAAGQFPGTPPGRRVVVLYTTAKDAGGPNASALSGRLRATGTILVVVGTADADRYWAGAAAATGGFFAPAGNPVVVPALDQVQTTLSGRYLVRIPTPPTLPATVAVRVDTGDLTLTGDVVITEPMREAAPGDGPGLRAVVLWSLIGAGALALVVALVLLLRRSRRADEDGVGGALTRGGSVDARSGPAAGKPDAERAPAGGPDAGRPPVARPGAGQPSAARPGAGPPLAARPGAGPLRRAQAPRPASGKVERAQRAGSAGSTHGARGPAAATPAVDKPAPPLPRRIGPSESVARGRASVLPGPVARGRAAIPRTSHPPASPVPPPAPPAQRDGRGASPVHPPALPAHAPASPSHPPAPPVHPPAGRGAPPAHTDGRGAAPPRAGPEPDHSE